MKKPERTSREQEIADLYTSGTTLAEIGEKYGISRQRVHQILKSMDLFDDMKQEHRTNKRDVKKEQLAEAIANNLTYDEMIEKYGHSRSYWYSLARSMDLTDEINSFSKQSQQRQEEIVQYLKDGHTQAEAAGKFNTAQTNISRIALRNNYRTRNTRGKVDERNQNIADDYKTGQYTRAELAVKYNVSVATVGVAINRNKAKKPKKTVRRSNN